MYVQLDQEECDLLLQLVDSATSEIGPEIRRTQTFTYKDDLKKQRRVLRKLHEHLAEAGPNVYISTM